MMGQFKNPLHQISLFQFFKPSHRLSNILAFSLGLAAILSSIATYFVLTGTSPEKKQTLLPWLYLNLALLLALAFVIARRLVEVWIERRKGQAGARLHVQLVGLFSLIAVVPSIVVFIFSTIYINGAVQAWFGKPVRSALDQARAVASAYFKEHHNSIEKDAIHLVNHLRPFMMSLSQDPAQLESELTDQGSLLNLDEILVFNANRQVIGRSKLTLSLIFDTTINLNDAMHLADTGEVPVMVDESRTRMRALALLDPVSKTYLYIGKAVDHLVLYYLDNTENSLKAFDKLEEQRSGLQITFVLFFTLVAIVLLLSAVWMGLTLANILVRPVGRLIHAAEQVSQGNWQVRVEEGSSHNEVDTLIQSFNRMTSQLDRQRKDLIVAHRNAAWADVARRIAHEIKNPLTPIQLSAERLKRRYLKEIQTDPETFQLCVDTIVRQVKHIGSLVSEFSSFARMPEPIMKNENLNVLCQQAIFLVKEGAGNVSIQLDAPSDPVMVPCDAQQISQVLTNLLQNAVNAIDEFEKNISGQILLTLRDRGEKITLIIEDNGPGFPIENRERLLDPYYTTRRKGTGLGLAIVAKIIQDHRGDLELGDSVLGGAKVVIELPKNAVKGDVVKSNV